VAIVTGPEQHGEIPVVEGDVRNYEGGRRHGHKVDTAVETRSSEAKAGIEFRRAPISPAAAEEAPKATARAPLGHVPEEAPKPIIRNPLGHVDPAGFHRAIRNLQKTSMLIPRPELVRNIGSHTYKNEITILADENPHVTASLVASRMNDIHKASVKVAGLGDDYIHKLEKERTQEWNKRNKEYHRPELYPGYFHKGGPSRDYAAAESRFADIGGSFSDIPPEQKPKTAEHDPVGTLRALSLPETHGGEASGILLHRPAKAQEKERTTELRKLNEDLQRKAESEAGPITPDNREI
jgi:hypothetical protein